MTGNARITLGSALRAIRKERRWSLAEASKHTGLAISTLSKIENGQRSLTYDKLIELAASLQVDIARLFSGASDGSAGSHALLGRRSVQREGDGFTIEAGVYSYRYLAEDLINKRFSPIVMELHARSVQAFDGLLRHAGEEFSFVIEGEVELHTELYAPLKLKAGESVYFDSNIGHAYVNGGEGAARILTIASSPVPSDDPLELPVAVPAQS